MQMKASDVFIKKGRGRIVPLLRGRALTVNDLAEALGLTDNAIRAHLTLLERDGLVVSSGMRSGTRKPHETFSLTPAAEQLFPKPHELLLQTLLSVLGERLPAETIADALAEVASRLAAKFPRPPENADVETRLKRAAEIVGSLGGAAEIENDHGRPFIRGYSCPLAGLATENPAVCTLAEKLLTQATGICLQEDCQKGEHPSCRFNLINQAMPAVVMRPDIQGMEKNSPR
jgi:predicted ArsR family transcriptional regulator